MATGKAIIYKGIPYFSDVKVPTRVSQLANDAGYLTTHQDISGKADKSATVSTVTWSNNKLTKTINGTTSDVVSAATILGNLTSSQVTTALGYVPGPSYIFESSDNSINISDSMVPGRETIDLTVNGKVSIEGDTISGDYINTANFIEAGVTGKRVTTYGPWGIDIDEYVGTSLWSKLALRDSDILLTKTWDGTNTSLKTTVSSLKQSLSVLYKPTKGSETLDNRAITGTSQVTYDITATHDGYISICYSTNLHNITFFLRARYGKFGQTFQGTVPAYYGDEPLFILPCVAGQVYTVVTRRDSATGDLSIKVINFY